MIERKKQIKEQIIEYLHNTGYTYNYKDMSIYCYTDVISEVGNYDLMTAIDELIEDDMLIKKEDKLIINEKKWMMSRIKPNIKKSNTKKSNTKSGGRKSGKKSNNKKYST